eukprot:Lithocolla_globosa_v1_NODE_4152_length_1498_cov_32.430748.p1 type:complete len:463 gc:universal NODE_4152_length_1498_cov_32.430748:37-1425(+)
MKETTNPPTYVSSQKSGTGWATSVGSGSGSTVYPPSAIPISEQELPDLEDLPEGREVFTYDVTRPTNRTSRTLSWFGLGPDYRYTRHLNFQEEQEPIPAGTIESQAQSRQKTQQQQQQKVSSEQRPSNDYDATTDPEVRRQLLKQRKKRSNPWFISTMGFIQFLAFLFACYRNYTVYGTWIQVDPFYYLIGPNTYTIIQMGAKYNPCIIDSSHYFNNEDVCLPDMFSLYPPIAIVWNNSVVLCGDLSQVCGMGGIPEGEEPGQWWRFITAIALHAGLVHLAIVILFQHRLGNHLEVYSGGIRVAIIYFSCGIFGYIIAAIFVTELSAQGGYPSVFGLLACRQLDLFQHWALLKSPIRTLIVQTTIVLFSLSIGLLPFFDNWGNIGGFYMGLVSGVVFLPTITFGAWDKRKKQIQWLVCLVLYALSWTTAIWLFYWRNWGGENCGFCHYFNCIPIVPGWCDII